MRALRVALLVSEAPALTALPANRAQTGHSATCTFAYTGAEQTLTVPSNAESIQVNTVGTRGASGDATAPVLGQPPPRQWR